MIDKVKIKQLASEIYTLSESELKYLKKLLHKAPNSVELESMGIADEFMSFNSGRANYIDVDEIAKFLKSK